MKSIVQRGIRSLHEAMFNRGLPSKTGIYFHSIEPPAYSAFREVVRFFREEGYRFTDPDDFLADPYERCIYMSFDDNYRAWYEAIPLFDELDVRVTFYVNTLCFRDRASEAEIRTYYDRLGYRGTRVPLSVSELRELASAGYTIGAHTHSHARLTALPLEEAKEEIYRSKGELESLLAEEVRHFSYPFGMRRHFSEALRSYCKEVGFATVANAIPGLQHAGHTAYSLNRSLWHLDRPRSYNLLNLSIDGRCFERLTGRSAIG